MMKKIAQFLPVGLALIALVMLLRIPMERGGPAATTGPVFQMAEASNEEAPGGEVPAETWPADAKPIVEQALGRYLLDETATASCIHEGELHADKGTTGAGKAACAYALADLSDEQEMNPVAAFWLLAEQGLFEYKTGGESVLDVPAFTQPIQVKKQYPYTAEGTCELLTDILKLSSAVEGGMELDDTVMGINDKVDSFQVFYDESDRCYYTYFVLYGERSAHFLCFYTRGGEQIDDLEFQLLNLRFAEGEEEALARIDALGDRQAATIMAAAEQLLAGTSRADEGSIPFVYSVDGGSVTIERFAITGTGERGTLTNYDLHIHG